MITFITDVLKYFVCITTGIVIVLLIASGIQQEETIQLCQLLHILEAAFVTAVLSALFLHKEQKKTGHICLIFGLHYFSLCLSMAVLGIRFGWIMANWKGILTMMAYVAFIYGFTTLLTYLSVRRDATTLNRVLQRRQKADNGGIPLTSCSFHADDAANDEQKLL